MKRKKRFNFFLYLILGGFLIKLLAFIFSKKNQEKIQINFKDFYDEEKDEVEELTKGKQSFKKFCHDSGLIFKEYFIPNEENEHKPKILRAKSLIIIIIAMILIKASVTGYLFFIYPNQARMTELIARQILELINKDRFSNNLSTLTINSILNFAAEAKARDMIDFDYFAHKSLNNKMPWDWIDREEYAYLLIGENLAMNFNSAQAAHSALMQSETHRRNILNQKYADIGLAVLSGEFNGKSTNILVQMFGCQKFKDTAEKSATEQQPAAVLPKSLDMDQESSEDLSASPVSGLPDKQAAVESSSKISEDQLVSQPKEIELEKETKVIPAEQKQTEVASIVSPVRKNMYVSPNKPIENNKITQVMTFTVQEDKKIAAASKMLKMSHYIFIAVLIIISAVLLINIFIKISIQHKSVIMQSLLVIIFITSLIFIRLHFLEQILEKVNII